MAEDVVVQPAPASAPLSVSVPEFSSSHVFVIGSADVTLSWQCKDAAHIEIRRSPARDRDNHDVRGGGREQNERLVEGKTNFTSGQVRVHVTRDEHFRLLAYAPGESLDETKAAERSVFVDQVRPSLFYGLLGALIIALISIWYLSEGLFHGVDLVENAPLLQAGIFFSRMVAVLSSVVGAPLVAALLQILGGRWTTATGLAFELLRRPMWSRLLIAVCAIPVFMVFSVHLLTKQRYVSSEIDRPVHIWKCDNDKISPRSALRLAIPPGLSSVRVMKTTELLACASPEGVVSLNRPIEGQTEPADTSVETQGETGFFAELFTPDHRITLTCNQRVVLLDPSKAYRHRLQWDDDAMTPFDDEGGLEVAKKYVKDCTAYSRWARFERETPVGSEQFEKLSWKVSLDRSGKEDTDLSISEASVALGREWPSAYVTLGVGDEWYSTRLCEAGLPYCNVTIPAETLAATARHLCVTPRPPITSANTAESCGQEQSWSYFESLDGELASNSDKGSSLRTVAQVGSLAVCLPPGRAAAQVEVESESVSWTGKLDASRPQIPWPQAAVEDDPELTLTVGGEAPMTPIHQGSSIHPKTATRDSVKVTITVDRVPKRLAASCAFQPTYTDDLCQLRADVVATGRGQHVTFKELPEWAIRHETSWHANPDACTPMPKDQRWDCTLIIRGGTKELKCTSTAR